MMIMKWFGEEVAVAGIAGDERTIDGPNDILLALCVMDYNVNFIQKMGYLRLEVAVGKI
jgi:hypothetical protein